MRLSLGVRVRGGVLSVSFDFLLLLLVFEKWSWGNGMGSWGVGLGLEVELGRSRKGGMGRTGEEVRTVKRKEFRIRGEQGKVRVL